jgi:hypothetical protein
MAVALAVVAFTGCLDGRHQAMAGELIGSHMEIHGASLDVTARRDSACHEVAVHPASGIVSGCADVDRAYGITTQELRLSQEQALVDDAAAQPAEARNRHELLTETPWEAGAAIPSAINLVSLDRLDEARRAFAALSGSKDPRIAGYAQLWQLWITMRSYRGDAHGLREQLARATVGLRAADSFQQSVLNLYAGQGSVEAVFSAAEAATLAGSSQRRDARTQAALFAGSYLQYVAGDAATARRIYRQEFPQSSGSLERPVLQRLIGDP